MLRKIDIWEKIRDRVDVQGLYKDSESMRFRSLGMDEFY